jgi:cell division septation protein DedD
MTTSERSTNERSTVLGVFADRDRADKVIDDLRHAGFSYNQIRLAERGAGSFLDSFKSLFTGQETVSANTPDDLMKLGVPEQDARYYQSQLDAGRAIVIVNATSRLEEALTILHQSGAYDISARLRTAEANVPAGTPQPVAAGRPAYNPNAPQGTYSPNAPQGTAPQGTYNPNVPPASSRIPPGTPRQE